MTLNEIKKLCLDPAHKGDQPEPPALPGIEYRPWWVVVVNPRRQPPQPKLYFGYMTREEAERVCAERQQAADREALVNTANRKVREANRLKLTTQAKAQGVDLPDAEPEKREVEPFAPFRYFVIERPLRGEL